MPMLFHSVIPSTCIMSRCLTDLKIRKTRAKRRIRKNDAAGKKCPNLGVKGRRLEEFKQSMDSDQLSLIALYLAVQRTPAAMKKRNNLNNL